MVSHCMDDLAAMCDRVAVMNEGRLLGVGAPERLFLHARKLKEVGLGTTEPQAFAEALRAGGWTLEQGKLYTEKELAGIDRRGMRRGQLRKRCRLAFPGRL